ncbi:MAG TPA: four helix bundle protein [Chthoniobacterales bacterium]|nr:four helix bundle protein [Chthoniobacterales bacterium]
MNYRNLEVWQLARELVVAIHEMTPTSLPQFETFEEASQIRRSIKSVKSNIVEGYGRRRYKQEFVRFIDYAFASCDETADHLDTLIATKSLTDSATIEKVTAKLDELGRKLNLFLQSIERKHISEK